MPVYRLTPIEMDNVNWKRSTHRGSCLVKADSEGEARGLAAQEYDMPAVETLRQPDGSLPTRPWNDPTLVSCDDVSSKSPDLAAGEVRTLNE